MAAEVAKANRQAKIDVLVMGSGPNFKA
jgi:hypothetical protein